MKPWSVFLIVALAAGSAFSQNPWEEKLRAEMGLRDDEPLPPSAVAPRVAPAGKPSAPPQTRNGKDPYGWTNPIDEKFNAEAGIDETDNAGGFIATHPQASLSDCESEPAAIVSGIYELYGIHIDTCDLLDSNGIAVTLTIRRSQGDVQIGIPNDQLTPKRDGSGVSFDYDEMTGGALVRITGEIEGTVQSTTVRQNAAVGENKHGRLNQDWILVTKIDHPVLKIESVNVRRY